ncbi:MAG: glycosyltransferase [Bacillota bacterium]
MKKVSVILLDWNVRESFHSIDSLIQQTVPRHLYEIIWVEYYDRRPHQICDHVSKGNIDKWIVLNMKGMYNKHHMYNVGLLASSGEIIVISDSDALYSQTFFESIISTFEAHKDEKIVLYLDEVRSNNKSFYPFKNHKWEDVMNAPGLINWDPVRRMPAGLTTNDDIIHLRNYGACFCAKRKSIIESGGFDEYHAYHCFTCGPYELGWRMLNNGYKEIWHQTEWLLHTWHPWIRPEIDIVGQTDRRGINLAALVLRKMKRVLPFKENERIKKLRTSMSNVDNKKSSEITHSLIEIIANKINSW